MRSLSVSGCRHRPTAPQSTVLRARTTNSACYRFSGHRRRPTIVTGPHHESHNDQRLRVVMTLDSLPGLGYRRVVSCKDSFHGTDVLAVSEHGAPGRRPNIHAHFVGRQRKDGLDTLPARAAEANRSTLIADIPFPAPENVAAKRCASEKRAF